LVRAWAADQLDELKQTYLDKLVEPIAPDGVPLERIMAHITGDAKHDLGILSGCDPVSVTTSGRCRRRRC
jgi:hypothetical protein